MINQVFSIRGATTLDFNTEEEIVLRSVELMREIVEAIIGAADEIQAKESKSMLEQGQLLAYAESLSIIRDTLSGYDLTEIGLDFDIDERYLY